VGYEVAALSNGNYVVRSPNWNGDLGAVTWGSGTAGVSGVLSAANSLVGSDPGDFGRGFFGVTALSNGNYVVASPNWNGGRGAVTWVDGTTGQTLDGQGVITAQNSLVGQDVHARLASVVVDPIYQSFFARFVTEGGGRLTVGVTDPNQFTYACDQAQTVTLTPEFLTRTLNTGTAVVLQASNDLTVNDPIVVQASGNGGALTLQAGRSLLLNANISTDNGALTLIANDQLASGVVNGARDPGPAVIYMAADTLDTGTGALTIELRDGAGLTNRGSGAVTLPAITAGSLSVVNDGPSAGSDIILGPVTTAGPQSYVSLNGTIQVTNNLIAEGPVTFTGAVALGVGEIIDAGPDTVSFAGGPVAPSPGQLYILSGLALSATSTFTATLNGTDPGSYTQVTVNGPVDLGGSTLSLVLGFAPPVGSSFTLLSSDPGPMSGTFAGLAEGANFTHGGFTFQITYQGGPGGNSVVITRVA
jgi:hypothetical protein